MGQMVGVVEKQSTTPGVVRFELNRSLSGMGHERFASTVDAIGSKPSASLARQLFATGKVDSVHVYGNIVTVDVAKGYDSTGLADIVARDVPVLEAGRRAADVRGPAGRRGGRRAPAARRWRWTAAPQLSAAAQKVPAHLLERSRAALAKWNAANALTQVPDSRCSRRTSTFDIRITALAHRTHVR